MFVSTAANALAVRVPTGAGISTSEGGVVSLSYGNIPAGTVGPTISSLTCGAQVCLSVGARIQNTTNTGEGYAGFAISGTNTVAAVDNSAMFYQSLAANSAHRGTASLMITALTPGSNTFTMQYRVSAGSGTFATRQITVVPF